jgi:Immunity protein 51
MIDLSFKPFWLIESASFSRFQYQLCLGEFEQDESLFSLHQIRPDGCTWEALTRLLLLEHPPLLHAILHFDSDEHLFCVHCDHRNVLETLAEFLCHLMRDELHLSRLLDHPRFEALEHHLRQLGRAQNGDRFDLSTWQL